MCSWLSICDSQVLALVWTVCDVSENNVLHKMHFFAGWISLMWFGLEDSTWYGGYFMILIVSCSFFYCWCVGVWAKSVEKQRQQGLRRLTAFSKLHVPKTETVSSGLIEICFDSTSIVQFIWITRSLRRHPTIGDWPPTVAISLIVRLSIVIGRPNRVSNITQYDLRYPKL